MANQGAKGKTFAPFLLWIYFCTDFHIAALQVVHVMCKKMAFRQKNNSCLRMSESCCNFATSFQRKRWQSPSVVRRLHILLLIIPIGFTEISQVSSESYIIGTCQCTYRVLLLLYLRFGHARASVKIQQKQYFFVCIYAYYNKMENAENPIESRQNI